MATKTSYNQRFRKKNGIFNKKGIFDANYLLLAGQNMNNLQHILHNLYLVYKYKKNCFKNSILVLPWKCQRRFYFMAKYMTNIGFAQGKM